MIQAWHFVGKTLLDGRPVPKDGEWLEHKGRLELCESGLHASEHPFDALRYAPGPILCRVDCAGEMLREHDKLVCRRRRIVARMDATEMLRYFARMQALSVIHLWPKDPPDVVLDYLMTGEETLRAPAADAAWTAARDATSNAEENAAWAATASASYSESDAAWTAARSAAVTMVEARHAARTIDARWARAMVSALDAAGNDFRDLVHECFGLRR